MSYIEDLYLFHDTFRKSLQLVLAKTKEVLMQSEKKKEKQLKEKIKENMYRILKQVFMPGQIQMLLHKRNVLFGFPKILQVRISLRSVSLKAYRYLRNIVKILLSDLSTIRKWASTIKINVSVLTPILHCMEFKGHAKVV